MGERFTERTRERLRAEILDAAAAEVVARGWRGLRMGKVAAEVGVSRQTIYNEFTSKDGLAHELVIAMASVYQDELEPLVMHSPDVYAAIRDTVRHTLTLAADDRMFKTVITADGYETFLPLFTSQGGPLLELVGARMSAAFRTRWPELDPQRLRVVIENVSRCVTSHLVLPTSPPDRVADDLAALCGGYLSGPETRRGVAL